MSNPIEMNNTPGLSTADIDNLTLKLCRMNDDDLFQSNLVVTLKPLIIEVSKNNENRVKLFELLVHINNRIRAIRNLRIPLEPFFDLFNDRSLLVHSTNLAHMYIKLCFPKCDQDTRVRLLPLLFSSLTENKTAAQKDILLHIALPTLQHVRLTESNRKQFELSTMSIQRRYLLEFLTLVLLTPYNYKTLLKDIPTSTSSPGANSMPNYSELARVPDGMSAQDFSRVLLLARQPELAGGFAAAQTAVSDDLERTKCGIVAFLAQRPFPEEELVLALCVAHADTRHSVVSLVDRDAKAVYAHLDWEKLDVLQLLLDWFIPRPSRYHTSTGTSSNSARSRLPVAVQNKMGALLMRSKISLPNKLAPALAEAASVTFLDTGSASRSGVHPKQIETGFALVAQLCAYCSDMTDQISEQLLKNLILFMQRPLEQHEASLKIKALNLIPQVLKRNHRFLLQDTNYLSQLFDSLCNSGIEAEIRDAVKDCLRSIAIIFQAKNVGEDPGASAKLESILYLNFNKEEEECRMAVVYFSGLVYSSVHIPTRFLLLEALGDQSKLVREEAEHVFSELFTASAQHDIVMGNVRLPYFVDLVNYHGHLYNRNLFSDPVKLIPVVEYIRMCILSLDVGLTEPMKRELIYDNIDDYRFRIYRNIQHFVSSTDSGTASSSAASSANTTSTGSVSGDVASAKALEMYCKLVQVIYYTKNYFMNFLEEIIAASPKILPTKEGIILHRTKNLLLSDCQDDLFDRENCASVHALLALEMEDEAALETNLRGMLDAIPNTLSKQLAVQKSVPQSYAYHGNALGFSYLLERVLVRKKCSSCPVADLVLTFLQKIDPVFAVTVETASPSSGGSGGLFDTLGVLLQCLCALGQSGALASLPAGGSSGNCNFSDDQSSSSSSPSTSSGSGPTKDLLARRYLQLAKSMAPVTSRLREASLRALAAMAMGESCFPHSQTVLEQLLATHTIKDPQFHRAVAQALVSVIMGPHSPFKGRWYERQFSLATPRQGAVKKAIAKDLELVMTRVHEILAHGNSVSRHNAAVWSVQIVQRIGWHSGTGLSTLHSRILVVLGDKDEMAQDAAACVLGFIYEQSSAAERQLMAEELIQVILHGQRGRLDVVPADADKFTDAELESREASKATYRELCTLATELNRPDLIYAFLPLASGHSKWAARGGASLGLCHLLRQGGRELEPHLAGMVPKLFRCRFDPHARTQKVMEQIWNNLGAVTPSHELIRRSFPEIAAELRTGLESGEPRVREASCRAMRALLKHELADPMILPQLGELVCCLLRVMDDTRPEIRECAIDTAKAVEKFCTIILDDPARRQSVEPLLSSLVPILLEKGLSSGLPQLHQFALGTLGVIVHSGRAAIRCAIPSIVVAALQALSSHEASESGYISQQLAGMGSHDSRERWDMQRVSMAKQSPLGDILTSCIRYIEDDTQAQLLVPLADIVRHGVGLATRCGTAEFLIDLSLHCGSRLMGATGKLLAALLHAVLDKNEVVQREMAKAIGCLVKYSKKSSVEKLFVITRGWYFENHDSEEHQLACCHVHHCIEQYAPGTLEEHAQVTFPLIFLAKQNEPDSSSSSSTVATGASGSSESAGPAPNGSKKAIVSAQTESVQKRRTVWSATWVECVRAEAATVLELMPHILGCIGEALASSFFQLHTQACLALLALVRGIGRQWAAAASEDDVALWAQLHEALLGAFVSQRKFWPGKIYLLYATMSFVRQLDEHHLLTVITDKQKLIGFLMRETAKSDVSYRCVAFEAVAKVSDILGQECLSALLPMVTPLINKGESQLVGPERELLLRIVGHMWPQGRDDLQETHFVPVVQLLAVAMDESQWKQQIAVLKSLKALFKKMSVSTLRKLLDPEGDQYAAAVRCLKAMLKSWKRVSEMSKYKQLREACLETIEVLLASPDILVLAREQLRALLQSYSGDSVPAIRDKSAALLKMLVM